MSIIKRVIIVGASASGKDYLLRKFIDGGFSGCLKCTSRPIRPREEQGVDYNYISDSEFIFGVENKVFLTHESFDVSSDGINYTKWYYGITHKEFESSTVLIMTPGELKNLSSNDRAESYIIYLKIDRSIREIRYSKRNDNNDSIKRRMDSDDKDFENFNDYDLLVTDAKFDYDDILKNIKKYENYLHI